MPDVITNSYLSPYIVLKSEFEKLEEPEEENSENNNSNNDEDEEKPDIEIEQTNPSDFPPIFDREDDFYIDIKDPEADKVEVIKKNYYYDFLDIYKDYLKKLNLSTDEYIDSVFTTTFGAQLTDYKTDYTTKTIKNKQLSHLTDYILKSNVMLDQTMRLHSKLFQLDETILHIKNMKIAQQERLRYYNIQEIDQYTDLDTTSNIILKESRRVSDQKYMNSLYNLYKYLNSSVILMSESLNELDKQNKALVEINLKDNK